MSRTLPTPPRPALAASGPSFAVSYSGRRLWTGFKDALRPGDRGQIATVAIES